MDVIGDTAKIMLTRVVISTQLFLIILIAVGIEIK